MGSPPQVNSLVTLMSTHLWVLHRKSTVGDSHENTSDVLHRKSTVGDSHENTSDVLHRKSTVWWTQHKGNSDTAREHASQGWPQLLNIRTFNQILRARHGMSGSHMGHGSSSVQQCQPYGARQLYGRAVSAIWGTTANPALTTVVAGTDYTVQ